MNRVVIIGLGLIGGSLAIDLRRLYPKVLLLGIDNNADHLEQAQDLGLVDSEATQNDLAKADLVVLAIPVHATASTLSTVLDQVGDQTLVIDMGSTKAVICEAVAKHPKRRNYLAMHPIAGTEYSGPRAAISGLFDGKTNIICEVEKTSLTLQEKGQELCRQLGMRIRYMDPKAHDKHLAYVSHLSHVSSFMLGKTVMDIEQNERDIFDLAGSGFESTVRLAKSSPNMWAPIFSVNREHLLDSLNAYIANLEAFKQLVEKNDEPTMHKEMTAINSIKHILNGIKKN
ncbi:prephenate dehydrogenase [Gilvibacter sp. SZ-19]|uniref:prephenate dehydrogenase n=1 Tax=Gilvibacter sp. SZ-19 TaxID=754429 RepID=UPI000B3D0110|nr:prephenate dehydrogenase [Gilvibacter sp. SZ-19]ARV11420.1 prephenate dehydrogenase [Gilvibacter sp. SZ-19]